MRVDPKLLVHFAAVAEKLSFIEAARTQNVSQPWLSRQVRKLEDQIGLPLFERSTRHVSLTPAGLELLAHARLVAIETETFCSVAVSLARQGRPRLKIGVALYALFVEARTTLIDDFLRRHRAIPVETVVGSTRDLLDDVRAGAIDVAFAMPSADSAEGLDVSALCEGGVDILLPRSDALCAKDSVALADLAHRTMAVFSRSANGELFDAVFDSFREVGVAYREYSDQSFFRHLERDRLFTALPSWQPSPVPCYVRRPLQSDVPRLRLCAFRARGPVRSEVRDLWSVIATPGRTRSRQKVR